MTPPTTAPLPLTDCPCNGDCPACTSALVATLRNSLRAAECDRDELRAALAETRRKLEAAERREAAALSSRDRIADERDRFAADMLDLEIRADAAETALRQAQAERDAAREDVAVYQNLAHVAVRERDAARALFDALDPVVSRQPFAVRDAWCRMREAIGLPAPDMTAVLFDTPTTDAEPDEDPCPHPSEPCAKCGAAAGQPCPRMPRPMTTTDAEEADRGA